MDGYIAPRLPPPMIVSSFLAFTPTPYCNTPTMQLPTSLLILLLPLATSTPVPTYWSVKDFTRTSDKDLFSLQIIFQINIDVDANLALRRDLTSQTCSYHVSGSPSTRAPYENVACGDFIIGSAWNEQSGKGVTTLSIKKGNLIIRPMYEDSVLQNGTAVKPDRSFLVQELSQVS